VSDALGISFSSEHLLGHLRRAYLLVEPTEDNLVPKMTDSRRKRIQAAQRKASNALRRAAKTEKRNRKAGASAG